LGTKLVDFLEAGYQAVTEGGYILVYKNIYLNDTKSFLHFLVENVLTLWLKIADNDADLAHILDEHLQLGLKVLQRSRHFQ